MNEAVHRFKRTKVLATSPEAARPLPLVCQECGVSVHYVRDFYRINGSYVSPRFDHEANSARARNCSLYRQGSENNESSAGSSTRQVISRSAPHLMIRVARNEWTLGVFMPSFEDAQGTFDLGDASPAIGAFDLSAVPPAGEVYEVFPQTEPYTVEIREIGLPNTQFPVGAIGQFSIFAGATGWGGCLGDDEMLAWNKGYVAIGPKLPAAFLKLVHTRPLPRPKSAPFDAVLFLLPPTPNAAIIRAAKIELGREISHEALLASVVLPVAAHCGSDRTWLVPIQDGGLAVAYSFGRPTERTSCVRLVPRNRDTAEQSHVVPIGTTRGCVHFSRVPSEYFEIRFDTALDSPLCVRPIEISSMERRRPWPTFAFGIEVDGAIRPYPLWHSGLPELFARIRRAEVKLIDARAPVGATVLVQYTTGGQIDRKFFSFADSKSEQEIGEQERALADRVRAGIAGGKSLLIEAGGFGRVQFPVDEPAQVQKTGASASLRSRWLDLVRRGHNSPTTGARYLPRQMHRFQAHLRVERQSL